MNRVKRGTFIGAGNNFLSIAYKLIMLVMMIGIGFYSLKSSSATETQALPLPKTIENVRMSMSLKDLVAVRRNLESFDFSGDPKVKFDDPNTSILEKFGKTALFDHGVYGFEDFSLSTIVLFAERADPRNQNRDKFVKEILKLYGEPDEIVVVQQPVMAAYNSPGLIWRRNSVLIMVDFTLGEPRTDFSLYQFKAFNTNTAKPKPFYTVPALKEAKKTEIITAAKELISRLSEK